MSVIITKHAEKRIRKRLGIPRKSVEELATKAYSSGKRHKDFSGSFKRYLDFVFFKEQRANNIRVLQGYLFVFVGNRLITVHKVSGKYRDIARN